MRNNKLLVSGSSYDRGLEHLLKLWPEIKKEVPEAQLRVFYGWDLFDIAHNGNPGSMAWKDKINDLMKQDGITHLGRISHEAVKVEFENAGIWAYPTHFGEISCITAMKAQAYGAVPVVINYAALKETVQYGIKVEGDIYEPEVKEEYKKQLIALLKDEKRQEEIRIEMIPWARGQFAWSNVAAQWNEEFKTPQSLEKQIDALMEDNQSLKAWDLVKNTDSPLKDKVYNRVRHAFEPDAYKKFYSEQLPEVPTPEGQQLPDRFEWLFNILKETKPKSLVDLGCADGVMTLIAAKLGAKSVGVNLYQPSVDYANFQAKKYNLDASFVCQDIFDHEGKYEAAILMEVLEHLPEPRKGIDHALSLLKPKGKLYLSTPRNDHLGVALHKAEPNHKMWYEEDLPSGHLRLWTEEEFKELLKGLNITKFEVDRENCMLVEVTNE